MQVVIASQNPVKIQAAARAFRRCFAGIAPEFLPVCVPSGVSDQPMTDDETGKGARNRVRAARGARPDADYWVGMEGGLERFGDKLLALIPLTHEHWGRAENVSRPAPD